jgi:hypothetical protein
MSICAWRRKDNMKWSMDHVLTSDYMTRQINHFSTANLHCITVECACPL